MNPHKVVDKCALYNTYAIGGARKPRKIMGGRKQVYKFIFGNELLLMQYNNYNCVRMCIVPDYLWPPVLLPPLPSLLPPPLPPTCVTNTRLLYGVNKGMRKSLEPAAYELLNTFGGS